MRLLFSIQISLVLKVDAFKIQLTIPFVSAGNAEFFEGF